MTDHEKAIVMAHTGVTMLAGDKFSIFHKYIEDICGRPIYTHELAHPLTQDEIKEKSKPDFIRLCKTNDDEFAKQAIDEIERLCGTPDYMTLDPLDESDTRAVVYVEDVMEIIEKVKE